MSNTSDICPPLPKQRPHPRSKSENGLPGFSVDLLQLVIGGKQESAVRPIGTLPVIDAAVGINLVSGFMGWTQSSFPVTALSATIE